MIGEHCSRRVLSLFTPNTPNPTSPSCAFLNTLFCAGIGYYPLKVTFWDADYTLIFRCLATQAFRGFCATFTFLPVSSEFLPSYYDWPEAVHCLNSMEGVDCSDSALSRWWTGRAGEADKPPVMPFLTFFSGHVAITVICANHMYINGSKLGGVMMHLVNCLQVLRLLATRGHYSIDLIMGWVVAVYVTNPAERLGRYYSKFDWDDKGGVGGIGIRNSSKRDMAKKVYEGITGVRDVKLGIGYQSKDDLAALGVGEGGGGKGDAKRRGSFGEGTGSVKMLVAEVKSQLEHVRGKDEMIKLLRDIQGKLMMKKND
ncbi:hypothetical protein TrLO_g12696 [Triparma laevis f. longispina]|uniref:AtPDCT1/2 transmembrane domain-containing protein n=1 Tax=Triparma laevis f. longispina TaxID=1714387 RepID=A0A9W7E286_9STRA|nr:hypothetical protein TrLO_g12696 [Triparma laevis f. longispina]